MQGEKEEVMRSRRQILTASNLKTVSFSTFVHVLFVIQVVICKDSSQSFARVHKYIVIHTYIHTYMVIDAYIHGHTYIQI